MRCQHAGVLCPLPFTADPALGRPSGQPELGRVQQRSQSCVKIFSATTCDLVEARALVPLQAAWSQRLAGYFVLAEGPYVHFENLTTNLLTQPGKGTCVYGRRLVAGRCVSVRETTSLWSILRGG